MEDKLMSLLRGAAPADEKALGAARDKWNAVAKPIGSLGELELMVEKIAGLTGDIDVRIDKRAVIVLSEESLVVYNNTFEAHAVVNDKKSTLKVHRPDSRQIKQGL